MSGGRINNAVSSIQYMSTSCRRVNISSCLWLQLVTEVPVGIWIRDEFNLNIDRSLKTSWLEYRLLVLPHAQTPSPKIPRCALFMLIVACEQVYLFTWVTRRNAKKSEPAMISVSFSFLLRLSEVKYHWSKSSFPEGARSYRFNRTRLPKKKTLKVTELTSCMNFRDHYQNLGNCAPTPPLT